MAVEDKKDIYRLADSLNMRFSHFARGTYPCCSRTRFTVNRLILVLENPNGEENCMADDSEHHVMVPGNFYLAPAFHSTIFHFDEGVRFFSIHFNLELFPGVDLFSRQNRILHGSAENVMERTESAFSNRSGLAGALELKTLIYDLVSGCLKQMDPGSLELVSRFAPYQKLIDYISGHCTALLTVEDLAQSCHISRWYFSRRIREISGMPPQELIINIKMRFAAQMLQASNKNIKEIAVECGYNNISYFCKAFRTVYGYSPAAFRNRST